MKQIKFESLAKLSVPFDKALNFLLEFQQGKLFAVE